MPGGHDNRNVSRLQMQLLTALYKLKELNTPVAPVLYQDNNTIVEGTKYLKELLTGIKKEDIETAIKKDIFSVNDEQEVTEQNEVEEDITARVKAAQLRHGKQPDMLHCPLSAMNRKEKISWLTKQMLQEQREMTGSTISTVRYGDPQLKPSFWLDDEWKWEL